MKHLISSKKYFQLACLPSYSFSFIQGVTLATDVNGCSPSDLYRRRALTAIFGPFRAPPDIN